MKVKLSAQLSVSYPVSLLGSPGCANSTLGSSSSCLFLYRRTVIAGVLAAAGACSSEQADCCSNERILYGWTITQ